MSDHLMSLEFNELQHCVCRCLCTDAHRHTHTHTHTRSVACQ